jgi:hypothetical protein
LLGGCDAQVVKVYLEESLRLEGKFSAETEAGLASLRDVFGLGPKEVAVLRDDVVVRAYRAALREKVSNGELEAAESKAAVLQGMCDSLRFEPAAAGALHLSLYRQKLDSLLEKKRLTDEDEEALSKMRRLLCLQKAEVEAVHKVSM